MNKMKVVMEEFTVLVLITIIGIGKIYKICFWKCILIIIDGDTCLL